MRNAVIGADGFGFRMVQGRHVKVPQVGNVEIGDDVEIGACTTIDRATFGTTRIGAGTKIDNHVQIAHNCQIGKHNVFAALVGIAGSVTTGDYVVMGGQVGIADHCRIGDRAMLGAKCGIHKDVPADAEDARRAGDSRRRATAHHDEHGKAAEDVEGSARDQEAPGARGPVIDSPEPIGLIAGWGRLPVLIAEKAKSLGIPGGLRRHSRHGRSGGPGTLLPAIFLDASGRLESAGALFQARRRPPLDDGGQSLQGQAILREPLVYIAARLADDSLLLLPQAFRQCG